MDGSYTFTKGNSYYIVPGWAPGDKQQDIFGIYAIGSGQTGPIAVLNKDEYLQLLNVSSSRTGITAK
jgi:hypothetical protein